jgi:hypothetical protein
MAGPWVFGAMRGDHAEVCRMQRHALQVEYNPFPDVGGCAKLLWVRRGLRFTVSLRNGVVFHGGRKTADFLGDRIPVHVKFGGDTATLKYGRKPVGVL